MAWFRLQEDLTVEQALQGEGSQESETSFRAWHRQYHNGAREPAFAFLPDDIFSDISLE